jgi:DNA-directed RNA polymerase specialized sigma24 family protein
MLNRAGFAPLRKQASIDFRTLEDKALLRHVLLKSDPAWRELVRRFDPILRDHVRGWLTKYWIMSDAVDETMGEFYLRLLANNMRRLRAFDPKRGRHLCSWLCLLAVHTIWDKWRQLIHQAAPPQIIALDLADKSPTRGGRWLGFERSMCEPEVRRRRAPRKGGEA